MFDKLIVSEPAGADFRSRSRYFVLSTMVIGIIFAAALVISIYAADYGLGTDSFDVTELIAPVMQTPNEPMPPAPKAPVSPSRSVSQMPTRQANIQDLRESPADIPKEVSTIRNSQMARPVGEFSISKIDSDPISDYSGPTRDSGSPSGPGLVAANSPSSDEHQTVPEPPPVRPATPPAPPKPRSMGVVNGLAQSLPKPNYPAAALAVNIQGKVDVQVLIDESGRVVSAKAVSGSPMLRQAAEVAARNARFSPTTLSNVPVKVTGVIVYNFTRS
jgi:protein TonB